jgi:hypothetical protein
MTMSKAYKISNTEGRQGRAWMGVYGTRNEAAMGVATQLGWDTYVLSSSFATVDGDGVECTAWCVYETKAECDADGEGAYAPRVVEVDA